MSTSTTQNRKTSYILGIIIIIIGVGFIFYMVNRDARLRRGDVRHLTFAIDSSGGYADITLTSSRGNMSFAGVTSTPWEESGVFKAGDQVYLTAGNPAQFGSISCSIKIDGSGWKSESANAPQDKVGCAGIIP
jgi:hypothetical protein